MFMGAGLSAFEMFSIFESFLIESTVVSLDCSVGLRDF